MILAGIPITIFVRRLRLQKQVLESRRVVRDTACAAAEEVSERIEGEGERNGVISYG